MEQWQVYYFTALGIVIYYFLNRKIKTVMAELKAQLEEIDANLSEASTEIVDKITELESRLGQLSPEDQALLDGIKAKSKSLADIVPNVTGGDTEGGEDSGTGEGDEQPTA